MAWASCKAPIARLSIKKKKIKIKTQRYEEQGEPHLDACKHNLRLQGSSRSPSLPFTGKESGGASPKLLSQAVGTQRATSSLCQPAVQLICPL